MANIISRFCTTEHEDEDEDSISVTTEPERILLNTITSVVNTTTTTTAAAAAAAEDEEEEQCPAAAAAAEDEEEEQCPYCGHQPAWCIICYANTINTAFIPCGHSILCMQCLDKLKELKLLELEDDGRRRLQSSFVILECPVCRTTSFGYRIYGLD